ncbi:myb-like protein AA isoform X3 [Anastrepha obliqua]|uniref:myb-like protein AA isoform X3 n=1 Tax=Anastrepha obliqua TaxID=95512 RepID=UPI002409C197|nr:myb-like protein AA isoform X3 [Anastrepha obliqua]
MASCSCILIRVMKQSTFLNKILRQFRKKQVCTESKSINKSINWQRKQRLKIKSNLKHSAYKSREIINRKSRALLKIEGKSTTKVNFIKFNKRNDTALKEHKIPVASTRRTSSEILKFSSPHSVSDISAHIKSEGNYKEHPIESITHTKTRESSVFGYKRLPNGNVMPKIQNRHRNLTFSVQNCMCCNSTACTSVVTKSDFDLRSNHNFYELQPAKKLYRHDHHETFLSNKTQLLKETLSTMQLQHHLSVQQQELIQQLQFVQRQYLMHQGFVKPLQLDFQAQVNNSPPPCSNPFTHEHQQFDLQQEHPHSLARGNATYYESKYLLQQEMYLQHEQNLTKPLSEYRELQNQQQHYDAAINNQAVSCKIKNTNVSDNSKNNDKNNDIQSAHDKKQFIKLIKKTTSEQHEHQLLQEHQSKEDPSRFSSECKSILGEPYKERSETSLSGDFKPSSTQFMEGREQLQQASRSSSATSSNIFQYHKRNSGYKENGNNNKVLNRNRCTIRQQQHQKELQSHYMSKACARGDDSDSTQHTTNIFPEDESMSAVAEDNMLGTSSNHPLPNGRMFIDKHDQKNMTGSHNQHQHMQHITQALCLTAPSPPSSLDEENIGSNSHHSTAIEMDEFTSWTNPVGQVSSITDDINEYMQYQHSSVGGGSKSRSRGSSNSNQNSTFDNGSGNRDNIKRQTHEVRSDIQDIRTTTPPSANSQHHIQSGHKLETTQSSLSRQDLQPQQQQQPQQHHHLGQGKINLASSLITLPPPLTMSPITTLSPASTAPVLGVPSTLRAAAIAAATAASHAQVPPGNAAAAVAVVAAAAAAATAASSGCVSGAPTTPNFGSLLDAISSGSSGSSSDNNGEYNGTDALATKATIVDSNKNTYSPKKYYHPLYAHGMCRWPGCELALNDFTAFVK